MLLNYCVKSAYLKRFITYSNRICTVNKPQSGCIEKLIY